MAHIWQYLPGGINTLRKRRTIYTWGRKQKADFIFLQETHSKHETERQREKEGERGGGGEESFRDQTDIFGGSLHVECITSGEHLGE